MAGPDTARSPGYAAPDGGWGWLVVFASFLLQVLTIGITYTFGVIFVDLLDYFKESQSSTAWIGSIQPALLYFTGTPATCPLLPRETEAFFFWPQLHLHRFISDADSLH